ncbi:hypothetical protein [Burkholderia sp. BE17]|uniref:hypothetical protein n=1 Tax=Burkholderia sp. BE17 TaxID=2656644 RepID=UPI00128B6A42|nr:hypothetical protein [Burkholderia sp. BE17]MPV67786.1 hypothetical protein [Burkholderia sp. BE17]
MFHNCYELASPGERDIDKHPVGRAIRPAHRPINDEFIPGVNCASDLTHLSKRFASPRFATFSVQRAARDRPRGSGHTRRVSPTRGVVRVTRIDEREMLRI